MIKRLLSIGLLLSATFAFAGDDEDDDDALFQDKPKPSVNSAPSASTFKDDDDSDIPSFVTTPPPKKEDDEKDPGSMRALMQTTKMPLQVTGKEVLADNWPVSVVFTDADAVVLELPVLYARSRSEFDGVTYYLVAEAYADGKKVAESRIQVTRDMIADKGPSIQFFRLFAPVSGASGMIEVRVGKATSGAAKPTPLFVRSVNYKL